MSDLQQQARGHLWLHFTRMGGTDEIPIIVRGEGCYLEDSNGKRYLDALAGLFAVNIGYSHGDEIGQAAHEQMKELPYYTNWSYAHPRAIELAAAVAELAPGDLNRVFFCSGGSEAVESAWKLARQHYAARKEPQRRWKAIARNVAYHGTTMGALSINGIPALRAPFEPLVPDVAHVRNTNRYHRPKEESEEQFTALLLEDLEHTIEALGPNTVAMVIMEPVQNAGGAFTPPAGYWRGVREICDRYDILLCADEVITGFGRLGNWFGSERYDIRPRPDHDGEGPVLRLRRDRRRRRDRPRDGAVPRGLVDVHARDHVRRPPGHVRDRAEEHRDHEARADRRARQGERGIAPRHARPAPRAADRRRPPRDRVLLRARAREGQGDPRDLHAEESEWLLRGFLSKRLFEAGLICRADDRGDPVIQLSPPLVAGQEEFDRIASILGDVLTEAWTELERVAERP